MVVYPEKNVCDKRFQSGEATIAYYDSGGSGDAVLLLHPLGPSGNMFTKKYPVAAGEPTIETLLDKGYRVLTTDMRCHGNSTHFYEHGHCGLKVVQDQIALLDQLGIQKAHIYGYSAGAHVALKAVVLHPERFKSLAMGGSGWANDLYGSGKDTDYAMAAEMFGKCNANTCVHCCWYPICCCFCTCCIGEPQWNFKSQPYFAKQMDEVLSITEAEVAAISIPVLGLVGTKDEELMYVKRMQGVVKDFTYVELVDKTHLDAGADPLYGTSVFEHIDRAAGKGPSVASGAVPAGGNPMAKPMMMEMS